MKSFNFIAVAIVICALLLSSGAVLAEPVLTGTSVATEVTAGDTVPQGVQVGWYKYTVDISWQVSTEPGEGEALSIWTFLLDPGCINDDHVFIFDDTAGYSTNEEEEPGTVSWYAAIELNGGSTSKYLEGFPLIKYEQTEGQSDEPGAVGSGTFCFYSNVIPQDGSDGEGAPWPDAIFALTGGSEVFGDLTGDGPSCITVAPPAGELNEMGVYNLETGKYESSGKGKNRTKTYTSASIFNLGDQVIILASVEDSDGLPIANAVVDIAIAGPEGTFIITSNASDNDGTAEAVWQTKKPNKKGRGGTATGSYTATVVNVSAPGCNWDSVPSSIGFVVE
jgi:hypothetical protein